MSAIANGGILYGAEPKVETIVNGDVNIDIDSSLSTTSENPVQNKVVTEAINTVNEAVNNVDTKAQEATNIAKGRNQAHVFNTTADMEAWLSNEENKGLYNVGDNLYIVEIDVPDWWIAEVLEEADPDTGYYYKIGQLETQKVDLSNYIATGSDARVNRLLLGDSSIARLYTNNDDIYFVHPDENGNEQYTGVNELWEHINSKLPSSGGTLTGDLITKDIIPHQADSVRLGINEKPFSSVRTNILYIMKNLATYINMNVIQEGTESQEGVTQIIIGNSIPAGTNGNARGSLVLYNKNGKYGRISPNSDASSSNIEYNLPSKGGTIPSASLSGTTLTINL